MRNVGVHWLLPLACSYLLRAAASRYTAIWTPPRVCAEFEFLTNAAGQTAIAEPVISALEQDPDLVLIVSDGYENDPPGAVADVARVYRSRFGSRAKADLIHANPVFDSDHFSPRSFGESIATVGLRDAEDLPTMLGFAKFASGSETLAALQVYLEHRVKTLLEADAS